MDYEKLVTIDADDLENELIKQPTIYLQISTALSEVNKELDLTTEESKYLKACKAMDIRRASLANREKPPTAQFLEDAIAADEEVHAIETKRVDLKEKSAVLFGVLKALEHKKEAMKSLGWIVFRNSEDM